MKGRISGAVVGIGAFASPVLGIVLASMPWWPWRLEHGIVGGGLGFFLLPFLLAPVSGGPLRSGESVRYITGRSFLQKCDSGARGIGALLLAAGFLGESAVAFVVLLTLALGVAGVAAWGLVDRILWAERDAPAVTLDPKTITVRLASGLHVFRYADLLTVDVRATSIDLDSLDERWLGVSTASERYTVPVDGGAHLAARIGAAIVEAQARAAREAQQPPAVAGEVLRRPAGMSAREWLDKIDAHVAMAKDAGAYRTATLDEEQLWSTFADEGANRDARAAAARVLSRSSNDEVRQRVATFAEDIGREDVRLRVAIAMNDDAAVAAEEIEALEAQEMEAATRG